MDEIEKIATELRDNLKVPAKALAEGVLSQAPEPFRAMAVQKIVPVLIARGGYAMLRAILEVSLQARMERNDLSALIEAMEIPEA